MLNFLDTHDTARAAESCANQDVLLQKLTILMTMTGAPCLYYGTEIAMKGLHTPFNRSTMPWDEIESGDHADFTAKVKKLIAVRRAHEALRGSELRYEIDPERPRLLRYARGGNILVIVNADREPYPVRDEGEVLFANGYEEDSLCADGVLVLKTK